MNLQVVNTEFNASNIINNQYTISLIKECVRVKILDESTIYNVQVEIGEILKNVIMKYTRGQSSSVTIETAEKLIMAIWYTMDIYISNFERLEDSIEAIKNESIEKMYSTGMVILQEEFDKTKELYDATVDNKLETELIAYNDTLINGIGDFFKNYNIEFEPHEIPASIDYPLVFDDWDIKGLCYIKNYLWNMYIENKICNYFENKAIENVLYFYGDMYEINYKDLLINIFELIITNAIFSIMARNPSGRLDISECQYDYLKDNLNSLDKEDVEKLINLCVEKLISDMKIEDKSEIEYINRYKQSIITTTITAIKRNNLRNILVITERKEVTKSSFIIDEENKLDDEEFKLVIEEITKSKNIYLKIELIREHLNSIKDLMDMLKGDCLFEEEFIEFFISLSDIELAILGKYVFYGEYRMGKLDLEKTLSNKISTDYEWQNYYIEFLKSLEKTRLKSIECIINK
jgi:hypothetical protein